MWFLKSKVEKAQEALQTQLIEARSKLLEASSFYYDQYVDPREAYMEGDEMWSPVGYEGTAFGSRRLTTEEELDAARVKSRQLSETNEWAINGFDNRISYIVGTGLQYRVTAPKDSSHSDEFIASVQVIVDAFIDANKWSEREQEIVYRADRDGEVFLRIFKQGMSEIPVPLVRFIEPETVRQPQKRRGEKASSWGIQTDPEDTETVLGYWVNEEFIDAADVIHIKANVTSGTKRGVPTYYPVQKNFSRAEKLLRNMSVVAQIQAAIALIRQHEGFSKDQVQTFRDEQSDFDITNQSTAKTSYHKRITPGSIVDVPKGMTYTMPIAGIAADKFVMILQAELRAIAARLVMPEFMFTSDASNANYASTMVAEGPAVKNFQRRQKFFQDPLLGLVWMAVEDAVTFGLLSEEALTLDIDVTSPSLTVRDEKAEAETMQIEHTNGVVSARTWAEKKGYDFDEEQIRLDEEAELGMLRNPLPLPGEGEDDAEEETTED